MHIIEALLRQSNFQLKSDITIFNFKVCSPLEPANPLYSTLVWSIYTINVSVKLVQGGTYFKIENSDQHISVIFDRK